MNVETLIQSAIEARETSYAPYSHFTVGAALLTEDEKIYRGCNIENAAYPASVCAERSAFYSAIVDGHRKFVAIAIIGGHEDKDSFDLDYCFPCGSCRQVMLEFCERDFEIIVAKSCNDYAVYTLKELLPHGFSMNHSLDR